MTARMFALLQTCLTTASDLKQLQSYQLGEPVGVFIRVTDVSPIFCWNANAEELLQQPEALCAFCEISRADTFFDQGSAGNP